MKFGLTSRDLNAIRQVFANCKKVDQVIIFGSRAMGNYKPGSDIDLAIKGDALTLNDILKLSIQLENLNMLEAFDLINHNSVDDKDILSHIERVGVILYDRQLSK